MRSVIVRSVSAATATLPCASPAASCSSLRGLVEFAERDSDPGQERGAEPVQRHPPAWPVEQRDAEFGLQARDRPAQRGLGHVEFGRGPADVLVAGDGLEVAKLKQVHRSCSQSIKTRKLVLDGISVVPSVGPCDAARLRVSPRLLAAALVFLAVQSTAVASLGTPLLPTVQRDDHVSLAASQWALTITLLAGAVATPLMGRLGDGRLRRQTTVGGVAFMLAGWLLSALPAGFGVFLAGRALQGAGLGLVPLATAVASDDLPADRSRSTIVLIGVTTAAGIGIGYPLVGLLAQDLGLSAPFWFVAGLSALALAAGLLALPAARPGRPGSTSPGPSSSAPGSPGCS